MMRTYLPSALVTLYPLVAALASLFAAQILKGLYFLLIERTIHPRHLFTAGGMPSSHSAMVMGLTTAAGLQEGWNSTIFCVCVVFSFVVLYDAAGVRYAVGKQAALLNQIIHDMIEKGEIEGEKLTELLGHTPLEVIVGTLLGIGVAFVLY